ncbi:oxidoreductase activity, acting on CH-OH group of donors protein [[Candida] boidinii]|nr:oxidoreductase activity, acting on CH-OH group of donors protein [[Candida] boidinii]
MVKVSVLGASGGIGQPLSLLLKLNPLITDLSLYDIVNAHGVSTDLSHLPINSNSNGFSPIDKSNPQSELKSTLINSDIVVIPAGIPRKPGMTRDDLFKINAGIVRSLVNAIGNYCPNAFICIISNPVNSTVAIAAEELKKLKVFNPKKLFGITTLDILRLETFLSKLININTESLRGKVITIGGHSGETIIPLLNLDKDISNRINNLLTSDDLLKLIHRVQFGGDEVVKAKNGTGSATLSMAYAAYRFIESLLSVLSSSPSSSSSSTNNTIKLVDEVAYVHLRGLNNGDEILKNNLNNDVEFFSLPLKISKNGIEFVEFPKISYNLENELIEKAKPQLRTNIIKGINFVSDTKL